MRQLKKFLKSMMMTNLAIMIEDPAFRPYRENLLFYVLKMNPPA